MYRKSGKKGCKQKKLIIADDLQVAQMKVLFRKAINKKIVYSEAICFEDDSGEAALQKKAYQPQKPLSFLKGFL